MHMQKEKKPETCFIFIGGKGPGSAQFTWKPDLILTADSGYELCRKLGYQSNVHIGDMDSITAAAYATIPRSTVVQVHHVDKDKTDTELCVEYAQSKGCSDITLIGGGGGRVDHLMGLLYLFYAANAPDRIITRNYQIEFIAERSTCELFLGAGKQLSVFSHPGTISRVHSHGLKWELDKLALSSAVRSISNRSTREAVYLKLLQGSIFVVWAHNNKIQRAQSVV